MVEIQKDELFSKLRAIANKWHLGGRQGNDGNHGNTIEDLLDIPENNLSLPDYDGGIEIKSQTAETGALITLFHREPMPAASVPNLIRALGWKHQKAGKPDGYAADEMRFTMTTASSYHTNRGFIVKLSDDKILFEFDPAHTVRDAQDRTKTYTNIGAWLDDIQMRSNPHWNDVMPLYWDRTEFEAKCREKLEHTVFLTCKTKRIEGQKYFMYTSGVFFKWF